MLQSDLLPFDRLWPAVRGRINSLDTVLVEIASAQARILRQDAVAGWDLPMADNSAMDGYAVRSADTVGTPCTLRILDGDAYAGSAQRPTVIQGTAVPIGTGGLLPGGADAIAIKEIVDRRGDHLVVEKAVEGGAHVRRRGEELRRGDVVVAAGQRLRAPHIAAAAAAGVRQVSVSRRPRVVVLSTGSELVPMGCEAKPGQVVNTNTPLLAMQIEALIGASPRMPGDAVDDGVILRSTLADALEESDVLVLSGGVSVGDRDLVKTVLENELGVERLVWRVSQKPGKPTYVGFREGTCIIGLPGNPAAVATGWHTLVKPTLLAMMGAANPLPSRIPACLSNVVRPNRFRTHLRWCAAHWRDDGLWAEALGRSGSHMLSDFARSELLAIIPPGDEDLPIASRVQAIRISE